MGVLVSVIMSVFNEEVCWVRESLESLINQSVKEIEIIIILDNPNNSEIKQLIKSYEKKDNRIKAIFNEENLGLITSLNNGLKYATGQYIARLDADDIAYNIRIEKQLEYMQKNNLDLVGSFVEFINENGENLDIKYKLPYKYEDVKKIIKYRNPINHPTYLVKREVYFNKNINGYREVPYAEDYDFITRVITAGYRVGNINEVLVKYRKRSTSITSSQAINQRKMAMYIIKMYNRRIKGLDDNYSEDEVERRLKGNFLWNLYEVIQKKKLKKRYWKALNILNPYSWYFKIREERCKAILSKI